MDRNSPQIKGWRRHRLDYGKNNPRFPAIESEEKEEKPPCTCEQQQCGCGCFVTVVNVDELDQN
jgi:hypothetical protein